MAPCGFCFWAAVGIVLVVIFGESGATLRGPIGVRLSNGLVVDSRGGASEDGEDSCVAFKYAMV